MRPTTAIACITVLSWLASCGTWGPHSADANGVLRPLSERLIADNSSTPAIAFESGVVLTDNDDGFERKLELIREATTSIDLAYYIFADDYSSSLLARELLAATERGVRVRMLLDYHRHYKSLDHFLMLEAFGNRHAGSLAVRFYGRPSKNVVKDAVFMTLGCGEANAGDKAGCSSAKFREIDARFAAERIDGESVAGKNISNLRTEGSGLFLSGLYGKNPGLIAMAVQSGQELDIETIRGGADSSNPDEVEKLKALGRLYWRANYGSGLDRLTARLKLNTAFLLHGEQIDPVHDAFSSFLPVERAGGDERSREAAARARQDWNYVTDFLHHKILLVDGEHVMAGGRNVEDSYHMNPNPLAVKYAFVDTDVYLRLRGTDSELTASFDRLWNFDAMTASLTDVRQHAPNDFLVNSAYASEACEHRETAGETVHRTCVEEQLALASERPLSERIERQHERMHARAGTYLSDYARTDPAERSPRFDIDPGADIRYIENLPFDRRLPEAEAARLYGARNDAESESGKSIHALWLSALKSACAAAGADDPQTVYLHNAYFLLPSNLLSQIAQMVDGRQPCAHVSIVVLTNSIETTDLNVLNVFSRHSMKALFEHYEARRSPTDGATLAYHEYIPRTDSPNRSLHSKVMVFGDDLYIGSANTDFRSYLMDSNNGFFIRRAPQLVDGYNRWLEGILDDPRVTALENDYYLTTDRAVMREEDERLVDATLAKYRAERFIEDPAHVAELKRRLHAATDEAYRLSKAIVASHGGSLDEQRLMNELFKAI